MPRGAALLRSLLLVAVLAGVATPAAAQTPEATATRGRSASPAASPPATPSLEIEGYENPQGYRASLAQILTDIDLFWAAAFETAGARYVSPSVTALEELEQIETGCGRASATDSPAFYCPADAGI
jgi:predicted metalloprotease